MTEPLMQAVVSAAVETLLLAEGFNVLVSDKILDQIFNAFTCVLGRRTVAFPPPSDTRGSSSLKGALNNYSAGPKDRNKAVAERMEGDKNQLLREQEVKSGVLPLMKLFAAQSSSIGDKMRESGLVERCQTQIENATIRIAQIEEFKGELNGAGSLETSSTLAYQVTQH